MWYYGLIEAETKHTKTMYRIHYTTYNIRMTENEDSDDGENYQLEMKFNSK